MALIPARPFQKTSPLDGADAEASAVAQCRIALIKESDPNFHLPLFTRKREGGSMRWFRRTLTAGVIGGLLLTGTLAASMQTATAPAPKPKASPAAPMPSSSAQMPQMPKSSAQAPTTASQPRQRVVIVEPWRRRRSSHFDPALTTLSCATLTVARFSRNVLRCSWARPRHFTSADVAEHVGRRSE